MSDADGQDLLGPLEPSGPEDTMSQLAGNLMNRLFGLRLSLASAQSIVADGPAGDPIAAATNEVNRLIGDIRTAMFALVADRPTAERSGIVRTARAMQRRALDTVALLEHRARYDRPPVRLDYPTEIKQWRAFADQADQIARRWERRAPRAPVAGLTTREREVLNLLAEGRTTKHIARDLDISINTCRVHIHAILDKLDAHTQLAAVVQAARLGLLTEP